MIRDSVLSKEKLGKFFMDSPDFTELNIPELTRFNTTTINSLVINNSNLQTISLPNLEQQPGIILGEDVRSINLSSLHYITNNADILQSGILTSRFLQNTKLQVLDLPELQGTLSEETDLSSASQMGFAYNYWLREVNLGNAYLTRTANATFGRFWFYYNYSLQKLALKYPYILPLSNITGLATTPIGSGKGFIYVPDNLLEDYQIASSWANFSAQFRPLTQINNPSLEDLDLLNYDTITDDWATIIEKCNTNSLTGEYVVGATKTIEINGMPTQMVIVDLNRDPLADSAGTAAITWMEKHISRYNPIYMRVATGSIRNYTNVANFHSTEKPAILAGLPTVVRNGIKPVIKKSYGSLTNDLDSKSTMETTESIWVPSAAELGLQQSAGTQIESESAYSYFSGTANSSNRIFKFGYTDRTPIQNVNHVALRTFTTQSNFCDGIDNNGRFVSGTNNQVPNYLIIGFCT